MENNLDIAHLQGWIGRSETASETVSDALVSRFRATLGQWLADPGPGNVPLGLHWCLTQPVAAQTALGPDGHPTRGGFLPPVPLPLRMWAGGEFTRIGPIGVGAHVTRRSEIRDVTLKQGRSGPMVLVSVAHDYFTDGNAPQISEIQNIVYRDRPGPAPAPQVEPQEPQESGTRDAQVTLTPDPVLLFRYSALTFNAHRIHYDLEYARNAENYPDLVVHGPLQATLLLNLVANQTGRAPALFSYRGVAPLFCGQPIGLHLEAAQNGGTVGLRDNTGQTTMKANYQI